MSLPHGAYAQQFDLFEAIDKCCEPEQFTIYLNVSKLANNFITALYRAANPKQISNLNIYIAYKNVLLLLAFIYHIYLAIY